MHIGSSKSRLLLCALIAAVVAALLGGPTLAYVRITGGGDWPDDWPEGLDRFRDRAQSANGGSNPAAMYEISFHDRDEFESAWEDLLAVRSEGSPITLVSPPAKDAFTSFAVTDGAAVRILGPDLHVAFTIDGTLVRIEKVLNAFREHDVLPEFGTFENGFPVPWQKGSEIRAAIYRVRTELTLIVGEDVIDLDRLVIPDDAQVIDKRFVGDSNAKAEVP